MSYYDYDTRTHTLENIDEQGLGGWPGESDARKAAKENLPSLLPSIALIAGIGGLAGYMKGIIEGKQATGNAIFGLAVGAVFGVWVVTSSFESGYKAAHPEEPPA